MTRHLIFFLIAMTLLGCSGKPTTPGNATAIQAARAWLKSQGDDPAAYTYQVEPDGTGWKVNIEYQPATPGAHALLRIDSKGNMVEVFPGA
jgi:hypothetical protein